MRYQTPLGEIYVPEGAPIVAPADVKVTPVSEAPVLSEVPGVSEPEVANEPEVVSEAPVLSEPPVSVPDSVSTISTPIDPTAIWHVMYRNDGGRLTVYVYPRERNIQKVPPINISDQFLNEIQGTREQVNWILERTLAKTGTTLGSVVVFRVS